MMRCFNPRARTGRDHAPVRHCDRSSTGFNPRARTGRDMRRKTLRRSSTRFNPRARTGRDNSIRQHHRPSDRFNPRARTGRDRMSARDVSRRSSSVSIHAPVRGATCVRDAASTSMRFNPRARTGRDEKRNAVHPSVIAFQSTRPYGARQVIQAVCSDLHDVSIHAPVRGATELVSTLDWLDDVFQSTRPYGARRREC